MRTLYLAIIIFFGNLVSAQLLITEYPLSPGTSVTPHESAMLEIRSNNKGVMLPLVELQNSTDQLSATAPVTNGAMVLNTSYYSVNPNIPTTRPALSLWDGTKWLFTYNKQNVVLDLDKVRNFIGQNSSAVTFENFPSSAVSLAFGEPLNTTGATNWKVLIDSDNSVNKPAFEFNAADAEQRMVIDVEGIAGINNNVSGGDFSYAVGVFVDDKLVHAQKFFNNSLAGACTFQKYNIRAVLLDNPTILTKNAGQTYNVKVAVRPLPRPSSNYNRLVFGDDAGTRSGTTTPCNNLNTGTARSYMNVLTIERHNVP